MLIYARIIMIFLLITSLFGVMGSLYSMSQGSMFTGTFGFMWSALFVWIAWTSWSEMKDCVNIKDPKANF